MKTTYLDQKKNCLKEAQRIKLKLEIMFLTNCSSLLLFWLCHKGVA